MEINADSLIANRTFGLYLHKERSDYLLLTPYNSPKNKKLYEITRHQ